MALATAENVGAPCSAAGNAVSGLTGTKPRFLDQVRGALLATRHPSKVADAYVEWVRRYISFHDRRHPSELDANDVNRFLADLAQREIPLGLRNQALAALMFMYREVLQKALGPGRIVSRSAASIGAGGTAGNSNRGDSSRSVSAPQRPANHGARAERL